MSEFEARVARAHARMADAGFNALLLTAEPDVRYVTGFLTRFWESPTRPWFVVLPAAGKPIAVIPEIGAQLMRTTWVDDIRTWAAPDLEDDGVSLLADTLRMVAGPNGRIGTPMGHGMHLRMPLADFARLKALLPQARFADATDLLVALQSVKSQAEIDKIVHACAIGSRAFARLPEIAHAGKPLDAVFRDVQITLLQEGADWVPYLAGGAGPGGYGDVISPASAAPLAPGDILMLDTGAVFDGYFCDFDRNVAISRADDAAHDAYQILHEATEAGLAAARPGATAAQLHAAMHAVVARAGEPGDVGRLGHGLGMRLTEWPSLMPSDHTVLEPGMVLTLEPGIATAPGRMMVHEENIVIRNTGAELLTARAPAHLPIIEQDETP